MCLLVCMLSVLQDEAARACFETHGAIVSTLVANCSALHTLPADAAAPPAAAATIIDSDTTLYLHVQGLLDPVAEIAKLEKQRAAAETRASALEVRPPPPAVPSLLRPPRRHRTSVSVAWFRLCSAAEQVACQHCLELARA